MAPITINRVLRKEARTVAERLLASLDEPLGVLDGQGRLLLGVPPPAGQPGEVKSPVRYQGEVVGWVAGRETPARAGLLSLLEFLYAQEVEKRALAAEVLDKYRELHLLYRLSEKLVASPEPASIGQMALNEVCSLVQVLCGFVLLLPEAGGKPEVIAACGRACTFKPGPLAGMRLLEQVTQTGVALLSNAEPAGDYFVDLGWEAVSILCAPLKTEKRVFGAVLLAGDPVRPFSAGDLKLLNAIAMQTAPAIEIAHLHQIELEKVRLERDLNMARRVQTGMLPSQMPVIEGWRLAAHWQPARMVSGDLYDFIHFPDGKLGLVIADVTDKGVPAALFMANTRSVLRGVVASLGNQGSEAPGRLLAQVNEVLGEDSPMNMFVTCLLVVLDLQNGRIRYANAGHNPPYLRTSEGAVELRAKGVPLGIFPDMEYEEKEVALKPGESLLMYSDGLVEAHNPEGEMFGFPRLRRLLTETPDGKRLEGQALIQYLTSQLAEFTGANWEQEDDVTLVTLERCA